MEVSESLCAMDFLLGHQGFTVELLNVCYPTTVDCTSGMSYLAYSCAEIVTVSHVFLLSWLTL